MIIFGFIFTPGHAAATWSIVAADPATGEVGGAVATCTPWAHYVLDVVPGKGVIVTQAASNPKARERGKLLISQGKSATRVIAEISDSAFDPTHSQQQHGVVVLGSSDTSAGYTGSLTEAYTSDIQGLFVSVQGNILVGPQVLATSLSAYQKASKDPSYTLADRLLMALEAGSASGGDLRCGEQTAMSAYLLVSKPTDKSDAPAIRIVAPVQYHGGDNAVDALRKAYDARVSEGN